MAQPFELWAKDEIFRLRTEADALERALARYTATSGSITPNARRPSNGADHSDSKRSGQNRRRVSKYEPLIAPWKQAGEAGMTLDELAATAEAVGVTISRNSLRSMVWNMKRIGNAVPVGDRYVWRDSPDQKESGLFSTGPFA